MNKHIHIGFVILLVSILTILLVVSVIAATNPNPEALAAAVVVGTIAVAILSTAHHIRRRILTGKKEKE